MPSTSSAWIESKRSRRPPSSSNLFQTRFLAGDTQNNNNNNNNHEQGQDDVRASSPRPASSPRSSPRGSPRSSLSPPITRQSTLVITKDNTTDTPQLLLSSITSTSTAGAAATTTTTPKKQTNPNSLYTSKSNQKADRSNAPKMSSMLNRVLDKAAAPNTNNNGKNNDNASAASLRSSKRETRASVKNTEGGKQDELPSGDGDSSNINKKNATATTTKSTAASSTTTTTASRSKKNPGAASTAVTSIAERLPKGSRAKPLPPKSTTPTTTSPSISTSIYSERQQQPTQTGEKLSQAISLSSSMPSIPSQMEPIDLDEDGDECMTESAPFYLSLATTTEGDSTNRHPVTTTTTKHTQQQHPHNTKKTKEDEDQDDPMGRTAGAGAAASHGIDLRKKQASVISIASSKDDHASIIPSVQVERIANWMGGVKEAMEDDDTQEIESTSRPRHQQTSISTSTNKNNASPALENPAVKADTTEDTPAAGPRKPALRRPPPAPSRHVVTLVDASPPLPPQDQAPSVFEVVPLSLEEEEPLQRNHRSGQKTAAASTAATTTETADQRSGSKGKRVFVEDSLASLPPVPLFHEETSNVSESDAYRRRSGGEPSSSTTPLKSAVVNRNHPQDDLSTIVGGQAPTQDSFIGGPVQSLLSFIYETEEEAEARAGGGGGADEMEHVHNDLSLPSELTSSCLQELGLKRKNVRDRKKRHVKSRVGYGIRGSNIDRVLEEGDDEDDEEEGDEEDEEEEGGVGGVALAQRAAFPSSFDLAPMSTLSGSVTPPLSLEVIEGPFATYTPAGRTAARENKENEHPSGTTQQHQLQQHQGDPPSFPSPPASLVFSTMPSMPTLPTFPSILYQEPSLIMIDSQTQQTQQMEEQTQSRELEDELDD
ncbi:hypothetical protein F5H01DRAFT_338469 [Linnemannia elongata]|nr:hypothetical protein F5H01DRAFT_338469 [Linnemannia elongata]